MSKIPYAVIVDDTADDNIPYAIEYGNNSVISIMNQIIKENPNMMISNKYLFILAFEKYKKSIGKNFRV
jgi:hypothetical protein